MSYYLLFIKRVLNWDMHCIAFIPGDQELKPSMLINFIDAVKEAVVTCTSFIHLLRPKNWSNSGIYILISLNLFVRAVEFETREDMMECIRKADNTELNGRKIRLTEVNIGTCKGLLVAQIK